MLVLSRACPHCTTHTSLVPFLQNSRPNSVCVTRLNRPSVEFESSVVRFPSKPSAHQRSFLARTDPSIVSQATARTSLAVAVAARCWPKLVAGTLQPALNCTSNAIARRWRVSQVWTTTPRSIAPLAAKQPRAHALVGEPRPGLRCEMQRLLVRTDCAPTVPSSDSDGTYAGAERAPAPPPPTGHRATRVGADSYNVTPSVAASAGRACSCPVWAVTKPG